LFLNNSKGFLNFFLLKASLYAGFCRAKIADFGLSTLRCKTSATVDSRRLSDDDEEPQLVGGGGTAAYMAPELLDSSLPPDFPSDVYSFGILLNEVASEVEPYSDQV